MSLGTAFLLCAGVCATAQESQSSLSVGQRLAADLTWTQAQRDERFGHMDQVFPVHIAHRQGKVHALPEGRALHLRDGVVSDYMDREHLAGLLVLQDGRVRLQRYGLGADAETRWTGFSMTKSVTDTLVGVALHRGKIHSLSDPVTLYLPELRGSAYEGVTVLQVMTMTTGVRWHEDYTTTDADNVRLYTQTPPRGENSTLAYMSTLPRAAAPGSVWNYNTGETDLLGVLLRRVTGQSLAEQLSSAVWQHAGMERDATWIATADGADGEEFGGSGLSATLRDWGRLALWAMAGGEGAVDRGWFAEATRTQIEAGKSAYGYGWWPQKDASGAFDGSFAALGLFGQSILIDPKRQLVIVALGDWAQATGGEHSASRAAFWREVQGAIDQERNTR
ncbi:serine hydrolase domain-containing protein [Silvibacterium sp.]|uniref:serine hydrolase domain-containing protein n=1 Tax=Silvibacterium sp. TaxID=1964179 RepID=UPI0039E256EA